MSKYYFRAYDPGEWCGSFNVVEVTVFAGNENEAREKAKQQVNRRAYELKKIEQ